MKRLKKLKLYIIVFVNSKMSFDISIMTCHDQWKDFKTLYEVTIT